MIQVKTYVYGRERPKSLLFCPKGSFVRKGY
jgi:hypothetical protein